MKAFVKSIGAIILIHIYCFTYCLKKHEHMATGLNQYNKPYHSSF